MKPLLSILFVLALSLSSQAQVVRYPFGAANFATITINNDTLTASSVTNSVNYYYSADTLLANTVIYASTASVKAGDNIYFRFKSGAIARSLTFSSTQFNSVVVSGVATKTKLIHFIFDGSKWVYVSSFQID